MNEDNLLSIADYDREIMELQRERKRLQGLLSDPDQREARRVRREQIAGRWVVTLPLSTNQVSSIREVSGDSESWLWERDVLIADGWVQDEGESWSLSEARR